MSDVFQGAYSEAYDSLYGEKDYPAEADTLNRIFREYADGRTVATVLDLGCGTGSHAFQLARLGYEVTGVDRSEAMLQIARSKARSDGAVDDHVRFEHGDVRALSLNRTFDAAVMMFAVLGYQIENDDVMATLMSARRHLSPMGLLVFDCWYGPAVLAVGPTARTKSVDRGRDRLVRIAAGTLDTLRGTCVVDYKLWQLHGDRVISETEERHEMRYFFKNELGLMLSAAGFTFLRLGAFPDPAIEPSPNTWNVMGIASAR